MKKIYLTLICGLVVSLFANCGKKDDGNNAPADMSSMCYYARSNASSYGTYYPTTTGATCNYNYQAVGFSQPSTLQYMASGVAPTCGVSTMGTQQQLVYSPTKGLGCVDTSRLYLDGQVVAYGLNQATMTFTVVPTPPNLLVQSAYYNQGMYGNMYYNNTTNQVVVLRVCDASEQCPSGQACRSPFGPSVPSAVGVCYAN